MEKVKKKPQRSGVPVVVRLPKTLVSLLDKAAESNFSTRSEEVRRMLTAGLKSKGSL